MITASDAIYAHAQDYAVNDGLQLSNLKTFAQCNSQYTLLKMLDFCIVCSSRTVCCSYQ
jgi:hypothetical protein